MGMLFNTAIYAVIFSVFYSLLFVFLFKTRALKITFASVFFTTAILYFAATLLMAKYLVF